MRLIDADKLLPKLWVCYEENKPIVDAEPTVEAIPIAWLEMFMQKYKIQGGNEYKLLHFMTTEWKKWVKKNECRGTDKSN